MGTDPINIYIEKTNKKMCVFVLKDKKKRID